MTASEVGRTATGTSSSLSPALVTQASSGANPSTCSFSFSSDLDDRNMGKLASSTPIRAILSWNHARIVFQMYIDDAIDESSSVSAEVVAGREGRGSLTSENIEARNLHRDTCISIISA